MLTHRKHSLISTQLLFSSLFYINIHLLLIMKSFTSLLSFLIITILNSYPIVGNPDAKRLYDDLMSSYNRLIRPVVNNSDKLTVKIGMKLSQLIDVNLKQQFMTTNIWLEQNWYDYNLKWDPSNYQGVDMIHVPAEHIWLPDIVLFNNYDGNYEVTLMTKARVDYTGLVRWNPPALYKSTCKIDVEYFPFDEQSCLMKFGSWTYDGREVDLRHFQQQEGSDYVDKGIDMSECLKSVEWDILLVPAKYNEEYYDLVPYPDITFNITTRRKTLFYTVNLIIPCVGITLLTVLVFYLPSDSGEKVTLSISILVSLTVFFLLLAETIPPTSLAVPLLGKYLIFTMMLITLSISVTVGVLNVHFRSPSTHKMSEWVRTVFIHMLPKLLLMKRPSFNDWNEEIAVGLNAKNNFRCYNGESNGMSLRRESYKQIQKNGNNGSFRVDPSHCYSESRPVMPPLVPHFVANLDNDIPGLSLMSDFTDNQHLNEMNAEFGVNKNNYCNNENHINWSNDKDRVLSNQQLLNSSFQFSPDVHKAIESIIFIAEHIRKDDEENNVIQDWKYVAMVLDRLFLWIFTLACFCGTCAIILQAPSLYDQRAAIDLQIYHFHQ